MCAAGLRTAAAVACAEGVGAEDAAGAWLDHNQSHLVCAPTAAMKPTGVRAAGCCCGMWGVLWVHSDAVHVTREPLQAAPGAGAAV